MRLFNFFYIVSIHFYIFLAFSPLKTNKALILNKIHYTHFLNERIYF